DGLKAGDIPLLPRILQVVDVYDALCTARPYKPALSHEQTAVTMLQEAQSGLWDEDLVAEFFSMLDKRRQVA
ncbi:MAG: HD domain-containing phosphohydrolase, partial [Terriglobales bacterium]